MAEGEKNRIDLLEWIKAVGTIGSIAIAAVLFVAENRQKQQTDARSRTLEQINDFSKGETAKAREFVGQYWANDVLSLVGNKKALTDSDVRNTFMFLAAKNADRYATFNNDVAAILDHLDYVSFCAQRGVCDTELVAAYYCKEVDALQSATQPTLADYEKRGIKIGANALAYFKSNCDGTAPANSPSVAKAN
jgi:hypothetical protein